MAAGQFTLALPHAMFPDMVNTVFYAGLGLLIVGNGLFKPNISTMVGDLYKEGDHRRDGAFTIFYMGINLGSLLAGVILRRRRHRLWLASRLRRAGIGMLLSWSCRPPWPSVSLATSAVCPLPSVPPCNAPRSKSALTKQEVDRIKVILVLGLFTIIFWAGFEQAGGLMNLYAQEYTDRMIGSFEVPTAWFQSLNPFFIITLALSWPPSGSSSARKSRTPGEIRHGPAVPGAVGFLFMIGAVLEQGGDQAVKTSMFWLVGAYLFHTLGELCLSPSVSPW